MATSEIIVDAPVQNITSKPTHVSESYDVMKLFNFDNLDVTEKLNDACKNKGTRGGIAAYHFHQLAITSAQMVQIQKHILSILIFLNTEVTVSLLDYVKMKQNRRIVYLNL